MLTNCKEVHSSPWSWANGLYVRYNSQPMDIVCKKEYDYYKQRNGPGFLWNGGFGNHWFLTSEMCNFYFLEVDKSYAYSHKNGWSYQQGRTVADNMIVKAVNLSVCG